MKWDDISVYKRVINPSPPSLQFWSKWMYFDLYIEIEKVFFSHTRVIQMCKISSKPKCHEKNQRDVIKEGNEKRMGEIPHFHDNFRFEKISDE